MRTCVFSVGLHYLFTLERFFYPYLDGKDKSCSILTDSGNHLVEHCEAFNTVFDNGISLCVTSEIDASLKLLHCVDMIHPLGVNDLQQTDTLNLTHIFSAEHFFTLGIKSVRSFLQELYNILAVNCIEIVRSIVEVIFLCKHICKMLTQTDKIPVFRIIIGAVCLDILLDGFFYHILYIVADIFTVKHLGAL